MKQEIVYIPEVGDKVILTTLFIDHKGNIAKRCIDESKITNIFGDDIEIDGDKTNCYSKERFSWEKENSVWRITFLFGFVTKYEERIEKQIETIDKLK